MLILIFVLLSKEVIDAWAMWNSHVYYAFPYGDNDIVKMVNSFDANFSGFDNLFLANHVSIGYVLWVFLFQMFGKGIYLLRKHSDSTRLKNPQIFGTLLFTHMY